MMGKFALAFGYSYILLFTGVSCASTHEKVAVESAAPVTGPTLVVEPMNAKDGGLVFIKIRLPVNFKAKSWKLTTEGVQFPVFDGNTPDELWSIYPIEFNSKPRDTEVVVSYHSGNKDHELKTTLKVVDGQYRSETLTVSKEHVDKDPPKKTLDRILREQKLIGTAYTNSDPVRHWKGRFSLPIDSDETSPFGNKRVYNGQMKSFHQGLDLRARTPTPILAPEGAKVVLAEKDLFYTGGTVILDHGLGLFTVYCHMSELRVKKGQSVDKGTELGLSGATGRISGPHLHWGAVMKKRKFNPRDLVTILPLARDQLDHAAPAATVP